MKNVGMYAVLIRNSLQKMTWKTYGIDKADSQINLIFAVLLYIMEQSLRDEPCTMDDIGSYIDNLNTRFFKLGLSYEQSKKLGEFIINVIFCDEGRAMYFDCYDFGEKAYQIQNISYVGNRIHNPDSDIRRTSYYLTDDGYNLLLGTLEIENNMKITIHEMIFKMHLEKASYDRAVDDIKNIFNLLRIQFQKIQEAMRKIRKNALNYSVTDYEEIQEENLEIIRTTRKKFEIYRELVKARVKELEEENINVRKLDKKGEDNLKNLKTIEGYLTRTLDEHQKILNTHFDLKSLYAKELEQLSQMVLIKRFNMRTDFYDKIMENAGHLTDLDCFFRPLFARPPEKIYNLNKAFEIQRPVRKKDEKEADEIMEIEDEDWQEEQERLWIEKRKRYEGCLNVILKYAGNPRGISLAELKEAAAGELEQLIPTVEIFREVIVELLKARTIDLEAIQKERREYIAQTGLEFQINEAVAGLVESVEEYADIREVTAYRIEDADVVVFENVMSDSGRVRRIKCSDVRFTAKGGA